MPPFCKFLSFLWLLMNLKLSSLRIKSVYSLNKSTSAKSYSCKCNQKLIKHLQFLISTVAVLCFYMPSVFMSWKEVFLLQGATGKNKCLFVHSYQRIVRVPKCTALQNQSHSSCCEWIATICKMCSNIKKKIFLSDMQIMAIACLVFCRLFFLTNDPTSNRISVLM